MTTVKDKPTTSKTPDTAKPAPSVSTARSVIADKAWRARLSPWKSAGVMATFATVAIPVIEYAATRTVTMNGALALPWAAAPLTAALEPRTRKRARADLGNASTSARVRGLWDRWVQSEDGRALETPAGFTRRAFLGQDRIRPRIISVTKDPPTVTVESPPYLTQKQWDASADSIGRNLKQHPATITLNPQRHQAVLTFTPPKDDTEEEEALPLIPPWEAEIPDVLPPLDALPVAHGPEGMFPLPLLDTHWLISGATRSGKGSVIWSIIRCLLPGIKDRTIELWGIDPKGGIELGFGRALFTQFAGSVKDGIPIGDQIVDMLERAVKTMETRCGDMEGNSRLFRPSPGNPAIVIIFDEMLAVELRMTDRKQAKRAGDALRTLLTAGAAASVIVIGAAQMTQKAGAVSSRDGFTRRVCLRVTDPIQVDMVLGPGSYKNGARADLIRSDQQGTGFMLEEGQSTPYLVRFPWCSDDEVKRYAREYPAPVAKVDTQPLPVTPARLETTPTPKPEPAPSPKREAVLAALNAGLTGHKQIAAAAGCSTRYVRMIATELAVEGTEKDEREGTEPQPNHEPQTPDWQLPPDSGSRAGYTGPELAPGSGSLARNEVPLWSVPPPVKSLPSVPGPEPSDLVYPDPLRAIPETGGAFS